MYYFATINYTKVQFDDSSWHNSYKEEPKNVNYKSIGDEHAVKKSRKINFKNNNFVLFIVVYKTFKYYV